jgi:hypothetical protein
MAYTSLSFKREQRRRMCGLYISQLQKRAKKEDVWLIHLSASKESKEGGCVAYTSLSFKREQRRRMCGFVCQNFAHPDYMCRRKAYIPLSKDDICTKRRR